MPHPHQKVTDQQIAQALADNGGNGRAAARDLGVDPAVISRRRPRRDDARPDAGLVQSGFVEIPVIFRDYTDEDVHYVYPMGDVHIGAAAYAENRWHEWVNYLVERKDASMLGTGDYFNAALKFSKSDAYEERMTVSAAKRVFRDSIAPLAAQGGVDVLIPGNHDRRVWDAASEDPVLDVAEWLGIPYAPAVVLLVYQVGAVEYEFYVRHGIGSSNGKVNKSAQVIDADVYVTGHIHSQRVELDDQFKRQGDRVVRRKRYALVSGSFLAYEQYAAERGYAPGHVGAPRVRLDGRTYDINVSL